MLPVLNAVLGDCVVLVFPVTKAAILEALQKGQGIGFGGLGMIMSPGGSLGISP